MCLLSGDKGQAVSRFVYSAISPVVFSIINYTYKYSGTTAQAWCFAGIKRQDRISSPKSLQSSKICQTLSCAIAFVNCGSQVEMNRCAVKG